MKSEKQIHDKMKELFEEWLNEDNDFRMRELMGKKAALRWVLEKDEKHG